MRSTKLFIIASIFIFLSDQCPQSTFNDVYVLVQTEVSQNYQIVSGCISPKTLLNDNKLKQVNIKGQDIVVLQKGAVSDILDRFSITFNYNNLTTIQEETFLNLPGLTSINLDQNNISWIDSNAFDSLPALDAISLDNNDLEILLHNTFVNLISLTIVSLDDNKLEVFKQDWFYNTPNLTYLFLNNNAIRSLPKGAFVTLPSLEGISLNGNKISYISNKAFLGLDKLIDLDLGKNKLTSINFDFKTVPNLSLLAVHQNLLNYFSSDVLKSMQNSLKSVWIYLNPWQCSCLDKIIQWGVEYNVKVSWKCQNTDLVCIIPNGQENGCVEPFTDKDYLENQNFFVTGDCLKMH